MARSIYNQAMKDELEIRPEVKSPWTDFKIQPERISSGGTAITWPALVNEGLLSQLKVAGTDVGGVQAVRFSDSYLYSQITANDGDQRKFALITDTSGYPDDAWDIFKEYTNYLTNRADPDSAAEVAAYGDASAVLTEMAELADKGDEPPYAWNNQILEGVGGSAQDQGALEARKYFVFVGEVAEQGSWSAVAEAKRFCEFLLRRFYSEGYGSTRPKNQKRKISLKKKENKKKE